FIPGRPTSSSRGEGMGGGAAGTLCQPPGSVFVAPCQLGSVFAAPCQLGSAFTGAGAGAVLKGSGLKGSGLKGSGLAGSGFATDGCRTWL
ncbi:MAG: hypothetical protein E5X11_31820, partial [Mesorhizobium sp.]